mgnify:CR=1 FL=1
MNGFIESIVEQAAFAWLESLGWSVQGPATRYEGGAAMTQYPDSNPDKVTGYGPAPYLSDIDQKELGVSISPFTTNTWLFKAVLRPQQPLCKGESRHASRQFDGIRDLSPANS